MKTVETLFLWFMIYAFIGWVYESTLCSITGKKLVNRGFLNGPVCPIYGVGAVAVVLALSPLQDNVPLLFLTSAVLTTSIEYLTSWGMEKLFHARWWDYSKRWMNLHGRVCLLGFVAFGGMAVLVIEFVHPWVASLTGRLSERWLAAISAGLFAVLALDCAFTVVAVLGLDKRLLHIRRAIAEKLPDARLPKSFLELRNYLEERGFPELPKLFEVHGFKAFQLRRLSRAFPHLRLTRHHEEWQRMRERLMNLLEERRNSGGKR